jgi:uncharacterized pyridoxal phosphate-containing UPF0001 family protein
MRINKTLLEEVIAAKAKLLVVTKYYDSTTTKLIREAFSVAPAVIGWGENRVDSLELKQLPREETHFIGRLQSRQLKTIVKHCATIYSVASLKHAEKLDVIVEQNNCSKLKIYIQVNVAKDPSKEGLKPAAVAGFLTELKTLNNLEVVGLSSMGWGEFTQEEKLGEFKQLIDLKNELMPQGLTSAGTTRDYSIALKAGIDIVRVGKGILDDLPLTSPC